LFHIIGFVLRALLAVPVACPLSRVPRRFP
jgi:hypothetical protein